MPILIVEDEKKTLAYLHKGLSENGFVVDTATNGEEGLRYIASREYELILLDVMLPRRDGWSLLGELRRTGDETPVLFLTARDSIQDRVKGLELGADDYLLKPFAFSELLARMRSILRRTPATPAERLVLADVQLDLVRYKATRSGQELELTPRQFALLALLAGRGGEVLSRSLIARQIWHMSFEGDTNVVDVSIRRLRNKVDDPFARKLIHTVRGVGYVMEER
jgi:two-component system copper resistance phosphate regulon response regulator CusR